MFDLAADPAVVAEHLQSDRLLQPAVIAYPGIRMPGAWDGFELAVRAIIGQQVSVAAATTIAGRIASLSQSEGTFPSAAQLATARLEEAGLMPARAATIRSLARAIADGSISLDRSSDVATTLDALAGIPGIGTWTVQYVAMRAFNQPDAFPSGDLVLRRAAGNCSARELERQSQAWRPWRAYAVMLLWRCAMHRTVLSSARSGGGPFAPRLRTRRRCGRAQNS